MRHYHYTILAYDELRENGQVTNGVAVTINHALDEENAIEQAKKLVKRPCYRLDRLSECNTCATDEEQKEIKREMLKFMKKHNHEEED